MTSTSEFIQLIKRNSFHWEILLNRPEKYNAINNDMYQCLTDVLHQAANDPELVLLTITGNGKFYSAGTDLSEPMKAFVNLYSVLFQLILFVCLDICRYRCRTINRSRNDSRTKLD